jgi:glycosyltransferase involved in cell wall biosynthesis
MNEAQNIPLIRDALEKVVTPLNVQMEIIFVCDPSNDGTEIAINRLVNEFSNVKALFLADRAGQTEAMRAGYEHASGDAVITMDADFQDPPELIPEIFACWRNGSLIVHTHRANRRSDKWFYRNLMGLGYQILSWATSGRVKKHVGDFRLIDRAILPLVLSFEDPHPFWRGITAMSGVPSSTVSYTRPERKFGDTKYSYTIGSPAIAFRGVASFSNKPLELLQGLGFLSVFLGLASLFYIVVANTVTPGFPRGTPTLIMLLSLFFAVQFISTAIIATYLIVLVEQTRRRRNYILLPTDMPPESRKL